jgi:hypothetical protein
VKNFVKENLHILCDILIAVYSPHEKKKKFANLKCNAKHRLLSFHTKLTCELIRLNSVISLQIFNWQPTRLTSSCTYSSLLSLIHIHTHIKQNNLITKFVKKKLIKSVNITKLVKNGTKTYRQMLEKNTHLSVHSYTFKKNQHANLFRRNYLKAIKTI